MLDAQVATAPATAALAAPLNETLQAATAAGRDFLSFRLGSEEYGIDILKVREIRGVDPVTRIAHAPPFIRGVINLRGHIVPVVDMRIRFNLEDANIDAFTVVIILNLKGRVVGMMVDGVSDVLTLAPEQIRAAPAFGGAMDTRYLTGLGAVGERMLILVDIEELMNDPDMGLIDPDAA